MNIRDRGLLTVKDFLFLDFAPIDRRKCAENDFKKWYVHTMKNKECLMGRRVYTFPIKGVKMCADRHGEQVPTDTLATKSLTRSSMRRVVRAKMMITNGMFRCDYVLLFWTHIDHSTTLLRIVTPL